MKHFNYNGICRMLSPYTPVSGSVFSVNQPTKLNHCLLTIVMLALLFLPEIVSAQCTVNCLNANENQPLELAVDDACQTVLDVSNLLDANDLCAGGKLITVRNGTTLIVEGTNPVSLDGSSLIDETLSVTITDQSTSLFCVSYIKLIDQIHPVINCEQVNISCMADTAAIAVGIPVATDNCGGTVVLTYQDVFLDGDCHTIGSALINRIWTGYDPSWNTTICTQSIFVEKPNLNDVVFPDDFSLSCDHPSAPLAATGQPTLDGVIIEDGMGFCDITVSYEDVTTNNCGGAEYQINRVWTVTNPCTDETVTGSQIISVIDDVAPTINCPDDILVDTNPGECYATVFLPSPSYIDNCDPGASFSVSTSWGEIGQGPHNFVPLGTHSVVYTAWDACGNASSCTIAVTVNDSEEPTAVCRQNTIVSIPSPGIAVVMASNFDNGSHDNCSDNLWFKARKMNIGTCDGVNGDDSNQAGEQEWFDDQVIFCCEEALGEEVMVIMRVYEVNPGSGPINPARELPGGDLFENFTECMVSVEIQDKILPQLTCPEDVVVDCDDDLTNLAAFGDAEVTDNCGAQVNIISAESINDCGVGFISRTFVATDHVGNSSTCTQIISVENLSPFSEEQLTWPNNFVSEQCGVLTDPDDLPSGFDRPIIDNNSCGIITMNYEDNLFDIAHPACYKILRTWTVLDWCMYEPEYPENGGRFTKIQVIKVIDSEAPVVECPSEPIQVAVDADCQFGFASIPVPTVEDCNPDVRITHDSPYSAELGTPDASGYYPLGTTQVNYAIADKCGNVTSCVVTVVVSDLTAPGAVCIVGLSINLSNEDGDIEAVINAAAFDGSSSDNCTANADLIRTVRRISTHPDGAPTATSLTFTCADAGLQLVEFWVTDQQGNSDYCTTYISVQDNGSLCAPLNLDVGMVAGGIITEDGETVEDVTIEITTANPQQFITDGDGHFEFPEVPMGNDYTLIPSKNMDALNGVSTLDLVLITQHILGTVPLNSPYKIIAADVDESGSVSTLDIIRMRQLILNISDAFPNGNTSWRFIPADFEFENPENPFEQHFPEAYNINDFHDEEMEIQFIAIKVGDVNGSAAPSSFTEVEERSDNPTLILEVEDVQYEIGETVIIPFAVEAFQNLDGYQFTLGFDTEALEFVSVEKADVNSMTDLNFGLHAVERGLITTSWNAKGASAVEDKAILFNLVFEVKANSSIAETVFLNSALTKAEAYWSDGTLLDPQLKFDRTLDAISEDGFQLYQNKPNPFKETTLIGVHLPTAGKARIRIFDLSGRMIYTQETEFDKGYNEFEIHSSNLDSKGILFYEVECAGFTATKKMTLLD